VNEKSYLDYEEFTNVPYCICYHSYQTEKCVWLSFEREVIRGCLFLLSPSSYPRVSQREHELDCLEAELILLEYKTIAAFFEAEPVIISTWVNHKHQTTGGWVDWHEVITIESPGL